MPRVKLSSGHVPSRTTPTNPKLVSTGHQKLWYRLLFSLKPSLLLLYTNKDIDGARKKAREFYKSPKLNESNKKRGE